jgi:hypothetical protein
LNKSKLYKTIRILLLIFLLGFIAYWIYGIFVIGHMGDNLGIK